VGIAVKKDDPGALAEALLRLIKDNGLLDRTAMQAGMIADTLLSWDRIATSLQEEIMTRHKKIQK
jgi:glycosyltransferase involved in cell wall biosynthesis